MYPHQQQQNFHHHPRVNTPPPQQKSQSSPIFKTPPSINQTQNCQICDKKGYLTKQCPNYNNFLALNTTVTSLPLHMPPPASHI